ncbi:putative E3 ubiquitin-protein ligase [Tetrabaena socialis]|uniref:RBR-type E3 ubiquitin transferase n=1 Tax=Tetrabaena socialis TaxID=47790 RepID=A0A2J7ZK36_9CHLO|nr:putative E3 ubiquitin-protein ligase [Tetrabaena socialis]|eukprot:PNH00623.1 putative E3 ubiquitin-protein ligase [Tetrabaena socialis]
MSDDSEEFRSDAEMEASEDAEFMDEDDDEDYGFAGAEEGCTAPRIPYKVLPKDELSKHRQRALHEVVSVLEVSEDVAMRILRKYKWDVSRVQEEWFSKYDQVRQSLGLVDEEPTPSGRTEESCSICFDHFPRAEMRAAACGHLFCRGCWRGYISNALTSGPACLDLRCPSTECKGKACVPAALVLELASPEEQAKYEQYMVRSYVEDNAAMSWCTGKTRCKLAQEAWIVQSAKLRLSGEGKFGSGVAVAKATSMARTATDMTGRRQ